jgi:hemerythrin
MTLEEAVVAKLQQAPENEREKLLLVIDEWIMQHCTADTRDIQQATAAVQSTWATMTLDQQTLRWVAEDKELEYDLG